MEINSEQLKKYKRRLLVSRMRILSDHGFYGLLLMHMNFSLSEECPTAFTDGKKITFGINFLNKLSDKELDFIMMHEILHVVLRHCFRGLSYDQEIFNIACDIVVNSNILLENNMDVNSITLKEYGTSMHLAPNKKEGYEYSAEEVYEMLIKKSKNKKSALGQKKSEDEKNKNGSNSSNIENISKNTAKKQKKDGDDVIDIDINQRWDDHSKWNNKDNSMLEEIWKSRIVEAAESISIRDANNSRDTLPLFAKRLLKDLKEPQIDWRVILNNFIQEEINDYSFFPPDRRFDDSPFFLPDFNEKDDSVKNVLFMIDTSGSINDDMISSAYSEIKGAIEQFNGKLSGSVGFFDAYIYEPKPFEDVEQLLEIIPHGGGGTNFEIIFQYVKKKMNDNLPVTIIILTDGYAPFPEEKEAMGIPVLWLLNNEEVTPPWGKIARIKI